MLKRLLLVLALLSCLSLVNAKIYLIKPAEHSLESNDLIELGDVGVGESLELVILNETDLLEEKWLKAVVSELPKGWTALHSNEGSRALSVEVNVPRTALPGKYNFVVTVSASDISDESFKARVNVKRNLLNVAISDLKQSAVVEGRTKFKLTLINDSVGSHAVMVDSSLPKSWFLPVNFSLKPKESKEVFLDVTPRVHGVKSFTFNVYSNVDGRKIDSFDGVLEVNPTLHEKYATGLYGLPFSALPLYPFYLINSFISYLIP